MLSWYLHNHRPAEWDLGVPEVVGNPVLPPCDRIQHTAERGLMGDYWASLCGVRANECDELWWPRSAARPAARGTPPPRGAEARDGRCPHCDAHSVQWRQISCGAFVCGACHRSFPPDDLA